MGGELCPLGFIYHMGLNANIDCSHVFFLVAGMETRKSKTETC